MRAAYCLAKQYVAVTCVLSKLYVAGNTCFVNVALQCLRYTPKLPQAIYPDLVRFSLMEQEPVAMPVSLESSTEAVPSFEPSQSGSELPSVPETTALADELLQLSTPSASLNSQADGPANMNLNGPQHSTHSTAQAHLVSSPVEPQQTVHCMSQQPQIPMLQLLQDQRPPHDSSQPVSIPISDTGSLSHPGPPPQEQLQGSSLDPVAGSRLTSPASSSNPTVSVSDSPSGGASTSGPHAVVVGPLLQQQPQSTEQAQRVASADSTPGDDSAKAPANQSTPVQQAPPVAVPRVPLKKGEIAESFRALIKQVSWHRH